MIKPMRNYIFIRNIFYLAVALCICITGMYSCKKNNPVPHRIIDADLKGAFDFQPGTYWILRDSLTGQVDSFYVRGTSSNNLTSGNPSYTFDEITVDIKEVNETPAGSDTARWGIGLEQNEVGFSDWYDNQYFNFDAIVYPFTSGIQPSAVYNQSISIPNTVTIGINSFNNVAAINFTSSWLNDYFYLNADVGFVKIILNQSGATRVWQLQRWNIVK